MKPEQTDIGEEVGSILYVGNSFLSFNNGIGWHVSRLHASANPVTRLRATSVAITGGALGLARCRLLLQAQGARFIFIR
jgi:hypothetical protein